MCWTPKGMRHVRLPTATVACCFDCRRPRLCLSCVHWRCFTVVVSPPSQPCALIRESYFRRRLQLEPADSAWIYQFSHLFLQLCEFAVGLLSSAGHRISSVGPASMILPDTSHTPTELPRQLDSYSSSGYSKREAPVQWLCQCQGVCRGNRQIAAGRRGCPLGGCCDTHTWACACSAVRGPQHNRSSHSSSIERTRHVT